MSKSLCWHNCRKKLHYKDFFLLALKIITTCSDQPVSKFLKSNIRLEEQYKLVLQCWWSRLLLLVK